MASPNYAIIDNVAQRVRDELRDIELGVLTEQLTLPQLIRMGSAVSEQADGWTQPGSKVCALSAAEAALRARR